MEETKIIKTDAKSYENIGKRTHLVDTQETRDLLLDDTLKVIETTLEKDGSTGKLSTPDGIIKGKPTMYRGFLVQCFGYESWDDPTSLIGIMKWYGFARITNKQGMRIQFDSFRKSSEHQAGHELITLIDAFYGGRPN